MLAFDKINHGAAINISSDGLTARRTNGFANGIVFTNRPINIFEKITFELHQQPLSIWQGSLRLGLYSGHQLPANDLPLSTMEASLGTFYSMVSLEKYIHLTHGLRITVWLTQNHCLNYAINNILRGTLIDHQQIDENNNVLVPLRLAFDLYGNTTQVQIIRDGRPLLHTGHDAAFVLIVDDIVPYEIKARGPDAVRHFQTACDTGTTAIRRTLLLIIGPKSSGKTRLKENLVTDHDKRDM